MTARTAMLARRTALALALLVATSTSAFAAGWSGAAKASKPDGRMARPAIAKARAKAKAKGTLEKVTAIRDSKSGKSVQAIAVTRNGSTRTATNYNVDKTTKVARRTATGLLSIGKATKIANSHMRRERAPNAGTFSGVVFTGVTAKGNLAFHSQTDRTQRVFVDPVSGKSSTHEK
jgi:hypothetical protein